MENSFIKRWITGIVLVAAILVIIFFASMEVLVAVIMIFILGGAWEFNNIVFGTCIRFGGLVKNIDEGSGTR